MKCFGPQMSQISADDLLEIVLLSAYICAICGQLFGCIHEKIC
jgi:hypothetical protein